MKLITINLSYYNQSREMLAKHLTLWNKYPYQIMKYFTFFIIDDGSKTDIKEMLKTLPNSNLDLRVFRVLEDLYCNIAGVRNLGAKLCETPYLLILDMDTLVNAKMAHELVKIAKNNIYHSLVFKFNRMCSNPKHIKHNTYHPAVCLIRKTDYWKIGGCEEDLVGHYGFTDPCFWFRAINKVRVIPLKDVYLIYDDDGEADIDRDTNNNKKLFLERKEDNNWSNKYLRFKWEEIII